jgi:DNA-binding response OmpR family regulator
MNKTILVVDYEQKSLDEIQQFLKGEHFTLLTAYDGSQALEIFETKSPDLVLTSALLPKLNGFELCKKITSGEHGEIRPVIMFSGIYKAEKYRKEAIIGCGAVDFLEKPLAKWQMLKVIKSLFSEISCERPARQFQASDATSALEVRSTPRPNEGQQSITDDLLQVEPLFERDSNKLKGRWDEAKLLSSEEEDELGAVVDAVRIDLDLETKLRDEQIAQAIEAELCRDGQNVLEFETTLGLESLPSKISGEWPEIIELDSDATSPGTKPGVGAGDEHTTPLAGGTKPQTGDVATPTFALSSPCPRNWIPFLIVLAGLLMVLLSWLRGR